MNQPAPDAQHLQSRKTVGTIVGMLCMNHGQAMEGSL